MSLNINKLVAGLRTHNAWIQWVMIIFGAAVMSAGFVLFTNPYKIIPGGVYGLGRVLHHIVPSIPTGTFGLMLDIPLLIAGLAVFGRRFGVKTVLAALVTPLFMNTLTFIVGEDPYDGASIISRSFNFADNVLVAAIFGGVLIGAGCGIIIKAGATSGGTDVVSLMMVKYARMKFSSAMFIIESIIVATGMFVLMDWKLPLYSLITIFVAAKLIDYVLEGASYDKLLFIVSDCTEELRRFILNEMERGGTYIKSTGMYTGTEKRMIFLVVSRREITAVKDRISVIDPSAFVVVVDAYETYGEGFKELTKKL